MRVEAVEQLPEPQIFAGELVDCGATHQLHSSNDFRSHQAKGPLNARLTAGRQRVEIETTDADGFGAERKCLQHVRSALDASIHDYIDPISYGIHNLSQLIERCARAIELSPAMVGQYNAGAADLNRAFCICHRHDALEAELAIPEADHLSHIIPAHRRVQHLREITTD